MACCIPKKGGATAPAKAAAAAAEPAKTADVIIEAKNNEFGNKGAFAFDTLDLASPIYNASTNRVALG